MKGLRYIYILFLLLLITSTYSNCKNKTNKSSINEEKTTCRKFDTGKLILNLYQGMSKQCFYDSLEISYKTNPLVSKSDNVYHYNIYIPIWSSGTHTREASFKIVPFSFKDSVVIDATILKAKDKFSSHIFNGQPIWYNNLVNAYKEKYGKPEFFRFTCNYILKGKYRNNAVNSNYHIYKNSKQGLPITIELAKTEKGQKQAYGPDGWTEITTYYYSVNSYYGIDKYHFDKMNCKKGKENYNRKQDSLQRKNIKNAIEAI